MTANPIYPFSNGSEYYDWVARNCERCAKYAGGDRAPTCELDLALLLACGGDGTIEPEIARRLGCTRERLSRPALNCPEREEP